MFPSPTDLCKLFTFVCLWYPTILCFPFFDSLARKRRMLSESCGWWSVCV